jgi:hypothetical protein
LYYDADPLLAASGPQGVPVRWNAFTAVPLVVSAAFARGADSTDQVKSSEAAFSLSAAAFSSLSSLGFCLVLRCGFHFVSGFFFVVLLNFFLLALCDLCGAF